MEHLFGIPGTVGGALYMNAGAYGSEMKDIIVSAEYIDEDCNIQPIEQRIWTFPTDTAFLGQDCMYHICDYEA